MLPAAGVEPQAVNTMAQVSPIEADYGREEQKVGNWLPVQHGVAGNGVGLAGGSGGSLPMGNGMGGLGNGQVVTASVRGGQTQGNYRMPVTASPAGTQTGQELHNALPRYENKGFSPTDCTGNSTDCTVSESNPATDCTGSEIPAGGDCTVSADKQTPRQADTETDCPEIHAWRQKPGEPPTPRSFSLVPHLKLNDRVVVSGENGKPSIVTQVVTGWQIQWSTVCPDCHKRFRPVAGFIRPRAWRKMEGIDVEQQKRLVAILLRSRFSSGRVNRRHGNCSP